MAGCPAEPDSQQLIKRCDVQPLSTQHARGHQAQGPTASIRLRFSRPSTTRSWSKVLLPVRSIYYFLTSLNTLKPYYVVRWIDSVFSGLSAATAASWSFGARASAKLLYPLSVICSPSGSKSGLVLVHGTAVSIATYEHWAVCSAYLCGVCGVCGEGGGSTAAHDYWYW